MTKARNNQNTATNVETINPATVKPVPSKCELKGARKAPKVTLGMIESRLQQRIEDSQGNPLPADTIERVQIPADQLNQEDCGCISQTLANSLRAGLVLKFKGTTTEYVDSPEIELEVEQSAKWVNVFVTVDGFRTGQRKCIAIEGDDNRYRYCKAFIFKLQDPATPASSWERVIHRFYR